VRQVPAYLIIGNGRVARHFCRYFDFIGISYTQWHRRLPVDDLLHLLPRTTHTLLLIRDDAIEAFSKTHLSDYTGLKIHFSGALTLSGVHGAHPLMTFGAEMYGLEKYQSIPFVVDRGAPDFETLLPGLANAHVRLDPQDKAKYHALCVMAGNFSCLLWQNLFNGLEKDFNIPSDIAHPYLRQQTENLLKDHATALTGPLARGDTVTMARNLAALKDDPFQIVYESFVQAFKGIREKAI